MAQLIDSLLQRQFSGGRGEPLKLLPCRACIDLEIAPLVTQYLCVCERLCAGGTECRNEFRPGFPLRAQELVAIGDGGLDVNPAPFRNGDRDRLYRLYRRGRIRQLSAGGLDAGETVAGDVKADASRGDAEPGICLIGDFGGLANAQKGFVRDLNLLGLALRICESLLCGFDVALTAEQVVQFGGTRDTIKDAAPARL